MQAVKGMGILLMLAMLGIGCRERGEGQVPEGEPVSPLKKVDEFIEKVEGVKPPAPPVKPPVPPVKPPPAESGEEETLTIPVAEAVPDKPGFVISPYNGKWIDVTGVKPGTLMADPHFTEEKKFFRVPEMVLPPVVAPEAPETESEGSEGEESEAAEEEPPSATDEAEV